MLKIEGFYMCYRIDSNFKIPSLVRYIAILSKINVKKKSVPLKVINQSNTQTKVNLGKDFLKIRSTFKKKIPQHFLNVERENDKNHYKKHFGKVTLCFSITFTQYCFYTFNYKLFKFSTLLTKLLFYIVLSIANMQYFQEEQCCITSDNFKHL